MQGDKRTPGLKATTTAKPSTASTTRSPAAKPATTATKTQAPAAKPVTTKAQAPAARPATSTTVRSTVSKPTATTQTSTAKPAASTTRPRTQASTPLIKAAQGLVSPAKSNLKSDASAKTNVDKDEQAKSAGNDKALDPLTTFWDAMLNGSADANDFDSLFRKAVETVKEKKDDTDSDIDEDTSTKASPAPEKIVIDGVITGLENAALPTSPIDADKDPLADPDDISSLSSSASSSDAEDESEAATIPVPPKNGMADFLNALQGIDAQLFQEVTAKLAEMPTENTQSDADPHFVGDIPEIIISSEDANATPEVGVSTNPKAELLLVPDPDLGDAKKAALPVHQDVPVATQGVETVSFEEQETTEEESKPIAEEPDVFKNFPEKDVFTHDITVPAPFEEQEVTVAAESTSIAEASDLLVTFPDIDVFDHAINVSESSTKEAPIAVDSHLFNDASDVEHFDSTLFDLEPHNTPTEPVVITSPTPRVKPQIRIDTGFQSASLSEALASPLGNPKKTEVPVAQVVQQEATKFAFFAALQEKINAEDPAELSPDIPAKIRAQAIADLHTAQNMTSNLHSPVMETKKQTDENKTSKKEDVRPETLKAALERYMKAKSGLWRTLVRTLKWIFSFGFKGLERANYHSVKKALAELNVKPNIANGQHVVVDVEKIYETLFTKHAEDVKRFKLGKKAIVIQAEEDGQLGAELKRFNRPKAKVN